MLFQSIYLISSAIALMYLARFDHYGLYILISLFWITAVFYKPFTSLAIWTIIIFMSGFALMRIINMVMNGIPSSYHLIILLGEIIITLIGIYLVKSI
jgi:hypothetical protein